MDEKFSDLARKLSYLSSRGKREDSGVKKGDADDLFLRDDGWEKLGEYVYRKMYRSPNPLSGQKNQYLIEKLIENSSAADLLFFDTETTGLSTGAGSIVFLIGMARINGRYLEMEQVFLTDFPGEGDFLTYLADILMPERIYVSFNGKSFDFHILKSRFSMHGMDLEMPLHLDLLHLSRRFWKRSIGSCSLDCVEREVLGIERVGDIGGEQVPEIYFQYLRTGKAGLLPLIFKHNLRDTESLVRLFYMINKMLAYEELPERVDLAGLGRYLIENKDPGGIRYLKMALGVGDILAGKLLGLHYKRLEEWREAVNVWKSMAERKSVHAMIELAKYYEHRERNVNTALTWVRIAERELPLQRDTIEALQKRKGRLERKLGGKTINRSF